MPPTASGSTAVLEYRPTETPPRLGAMLPGFARLCRRYLPARPPKWRKTWASPGAEEEIRRETDCLLEGTGFEISVPRYPWWYRGSARDAIRAGQRVASEFVSTHCKGELGFDFRVDRLRFQGFVACLPA